MLYGSDAGPQGARRRRQVGSAVSVCLCSPNSAARPRITADDLARRIAGLGPGERLAVLGVGRAAIGTLVSESTERGALLVADADRSGAAALIDRLLDDLAALALTRWPYWHGRDASAAPVSADPWLKAASKRARLGLTPRFHRMTRELELLRLVGARRREAMISAFKADLSAAMVGS